MPLTLEEAKSLKPGDPVWTGHYRDGQVEYIRWEVYEPPVERRFPDDPSIICYLDGGYGIQAYVFSDQLYRYYHRDPARTLY